MTIRSRNTFYRLKFTIMDHARRLSTQEAADVHRTAQRAERQRIVEEAMHSNKMEGFTVTDAMRTDAVAFVSGKIDADEMVRRTRARCGLEPERC